MTLFFYTGIITLVGGECWNRQTGTVEVRVSLTYGFKSRFSHHFLKKVDCRKAVDFFVFTARWMFKKSCIHIFFRRSAQTAYSNLLSGDISLLRDTQLGQEWMDVLLPNSKLEYTTLDLAGDGIMTRLK